MSASLTLLAEPSWAGVPVVGDRSVDLLACLLLAGGRGASVESLVEELWPVTPPGNGAKALQVVVSRTRKATTHDLVESQPHGYRLGAHPVDAVDLERAVQRSAAALRSGDVADAIEAARRATAVRILDAAGAGPLGRLRDRARAQLRQAQRTLGLALARSGSHDQGLALLEAAHSADPSDEEVLDALLRSEADVKGPAAALERYERYRRDLAERLGVDPSATLKRVHTHLLLVDRPSRHGVRYAADDLIGRDADLGALLALVERHRLVTVLGPGGLGKTRMVQLVARHATEPVVHVVELVGVRSGDDVVGEVGSALGVRDSVTAHSALSRAQRADLRSRIASLLDRSPALLVLDNCEHVVDAVAELVAFLVASTRDLRVLTTSRSPLAIAAERVYPLAQLDAADAAKLFCLRAAGVRPGAALDPGDVAAVVDRLDGLPLAIELAAAKVRVMSVAEIGRRLENRFELLRGGDRSAPDRHRTLLAVIDWSWGLLDDAERRALRRLSVFADGFTLESAEALVGAGALDAVHGLVEQSLLAVAENKGGVRFRMLETVREFGRMHLVDTGEDGDAEAAERDWALSYVSGADRDLFSRDQPEAVARVLAEEINLSDVLRRALNAGDLDALVAIMAALASLWTIRGEHPRVMMLAGPVDAAMATYRPSDQAAQACRLAMALVGMSSVIAGRDAAQHSRRLLAELGPGNVPTTAALVRVMTALHQTPVEGAAGALEHLTHDADRTTRALALLWSAQLHENLGDGPTAISQVRSALALWRAEDGLWTRAMLHMTLAQLAAQRGDLGTAAEHAERALPDLMRLTATDDEIDARSILALDALRRGDFERAGALVEANKAQAPGPWVFGGVGVNLAVQAELELAQGLVDRGLNTYRLMVVALERPLPGIDAAVVGPWNLYGLASATAVHALHGAGQDLFEDLARRAPTVLEGDRVDYPVLGLVLFALGLGGLRHGRLDPEEAVRLLALADRLGYARVSPSLAWDRALRLVERHGLLRSLAAEQARYGAHRTPDLLGEIESIVTALPARTSG